MSRSCCCKLKGLFLLAPDLPCSSLIQILTLYSTFSSRFALFTSCWIMPPIRHHKTASPQRRTPYSTSSRSKSGYSLLPLKPPRPRPATFLTWRRRNPLFPSKFARKTRLPACQACLLDRLSHLTVTYPLQHPPIHLSLLSSGYPLENNAYSASGPTPVDLMLRSIEFSLFADAGRGPRYPATQRQRSSSGRHNCDSYKACMSHCLTIL